MISLAGVRSGDYAWIAIIGSAVAYELLADDLLSEATERYYRKYPVITRIVIITVASHLAGILPRSVDPFHASNIIHRGIVAATHGERLGGALRRTA